MAVLINMYQGDGTFRHTDNYHSDRDVPPYMILSHTWGTPGQEVSFHDITEGRGQDKEGYRKVLLCMRQAHLNRLQHIWVDTCCIDQKNYPELSEAIRSMFRWYQNAETCYVYLSDVTVREDAESGSHKVWEAEFVNSRWFKRGWTLQELLAPPVVEFFSKDGSYIGSKKTLEWLICEATDISPWALRGVELSTFGVEERLSWSARRETTLKEDEAYCLQGIFGVFIPVMYGEREDAYRRLKKAIEELQTPEHGKHLDERLRFNASQQSMPSAEELARQDSLILQSLAFPEMHDRRLNVEPHHPHTCEWILDMTGYQQWISTFQGLLWIKGKPGAGKSVVMAFLYNHLKDKAERKSERLAEVQLNFFFNARGTELQHTLYGMLRSLLHQLLSEDVSIRPRIRRVFEEKNRSFGDSSSSWMWHVSELKSFFNELVIVVARQRSVAIFVDALDEAGEEPARNMAEYFHQINKQAMLIQAQLKICISCRHVPVITSKSSSYQVVVEDHNQSDIARFITGTLCLDNAINQNPSELKDLRTLERDLVRKSQGLFQWACLAVSMVQKRIDKGESPLWIRDKLKDVPAELRDVYIQILQNVVDQEDLVLSFWIFLWVSFAERPLTVTEMRYVLIKDGHDRITTDERMIIRTKSLSGGLLETARNKSNGTDYVQASHQSVNDFMRVEGLAFLASLNDSVSKILLSFPGSHSHGDLHSQYHARLHQECLQYLSSQDVLECENYTGTLEELERRLPFLRYATMSLFLHAEKVAAASCANDSSDIHEALVKTFPRWALFHSFFNHPKKFPVYREPNHLKHVHENYFILHEAARANMVDTVQYLLRGGWDMSVSDRDGKTAMHLAAQQGHCDIASILVGAGAKIDVTDRRGVTPLTYAAGSARMSMVKWLLSQGARVTAATAGARGPLYEAAENGHCELVRVLIQAGSDLGRDQGYHSTALQVACYRNHTDVVRVLLASGADINGSGTFYGRALQAACHLGHPEMVRLLLAAGADVNAKGPQDSSALQTASWSGSREVVQVLLTAGADVNMRGAKHGTALEIASNRGFQDIQSLLRHYGADESPATLTARVDNNQAADCELM